MQLFLKLYFLVILRVSERQQNYKSARKEAYLEFIPLASIDMMIPKTKHMQTPCIPENSRTLVSTIQNNRSHVF